MSGFFKLHYDITQWEHWHNPKMLVVFIHLLARARWDKKPTRYKGVIIERGQCLIGRQEFAEECGLGVQTVRTCLETLKLTNEITTKVTNKGTIVTIEKYAFWQDKFVDATTKVTTKLTSDQPPTNHPLTTHQPLNNKDNKENNPYKVNDMWQGLKHKEWA